MTSTTARNFATYNEMLADEQQNASSEIHPRQHPTSYPRTTVHTVDRAPAFGHVLGYAPLVGPERTSLLPTSQANISTAPAAHIHQDVSDFSYQDFLTPEYSSDPSAYTTPSFEEFLSDPNLIGQYQDTDELPTDNERARTPQTHNNLPQDFWTPDLQSGTSPHHSRGVRQLLSPQPTTTPSPREALKSAHNPAPTSTARLARGYIAYMSDENQSSNGLGDNTAAPGDLGTSTQDGGPGVGWEDQPAKAVSPRVTVSTHTRGDSPARPKGLVARNSSKRSHSSRASELVVPDRPEHAFDTTADVLPVANQDPSVLRQGGASMDNDADPHRTGVGPSDRIDLSVLSIKDLEEQRKLDEKNADVETWLATSETGSRASEDDQKPSKGPHSDPRANLAWKKEIDDSHIPGPGVLVDVESGDDESTYSAFLSSDGPSSPAVEPGATDLTTTSQNYSDVEVAPEESEPLPRQFYRRTPWQDQVRYTEHSTSRDQPDSSSAAMYRFEQQAANFETASRAATWGTGRRMSESEINSVVEGSKVRHPSLSKKHRERGASFISRFMPGRAPSNARRKPTPSETAGEVPEADQSGFGSNQGSLQRMASSGKSKSPSRVAGNALKAVASHISSRNQSNTSENRISAGAFPSLKRNRSKNEMPGNNQKGKSTPGLADLWIQHGGPPLPSLGSPMQEKREPSPSLPHQSPVGDDDEEDEDEDEDEEDILNEKGVRMDLQVRTETIIPTLEGFRTQISQLNPRLDHNLVERMAHEQVRRYKKLVEAKVKHAHAVRVQGRCSSGKHCFDLNGEATLLPPRASGRDSESKYAQFQVPGYEDTEEDEALVAEGAATPALFPSGIPPPPVRRLPAEFECPFCFKVKKFLKPSDWTKHVHEDVQPFSCTFPLCPDPKSFKRKADWVRHENERHRHLEWWQCNIQDCNHVCYRKDNFVQHLVREHKLPEPKVKSRGSGSSKYRAGGMPSDTVDEVWRLLEICHHDTPKKPRDETCKFCGNVCNTWKKVSSHLGKHMEQIALPVLELVRQREVSPDTVISPIEPVYQPQIPRSSLPPASAARYVPPNAGTVWQEPPPTHATIPGRDYSQQIQYLRGVEAPSEPRSNVHSPFHGLGDAAGGPSAYNPYLNHGMPPAVPVATYPPPHRPLQQSPLQTQEHLADTHVAQVMPLNLSSNPVYPSQQFPQAMYASPVETQHYIPHYVQGMHHGPNVGHTASQIPYATVPPEVSRSLTNDAMYGRPDMGGYHVPGPGREGPGYHQY